MRAASTVLDLAIHVARFDKGLTAMGLYLSYWPRPP